MIRFVSDATEAKNLHVVYKQKQLWRELFATSFLICFASLARCITVINTNYVASTRYTDERKYSLESLRTSLLGLHNFLHSVNLSTKEKWKLMNVNWLSTVNFIVISLCSHSCTRWTRLGWKFATFSQVLTAEKLYRYGETNFRLSIDAQLLRWKIDATLSEILNETFSVAVVLLTQSENVQLCNFVLRCRCEN